MSTRGHGLQRKKLLRDVGSTRSELEKANSLEEEIKQIENLSTITEELLQKVRNANDQMSVLQDPEIRAKAAAAVREASKRSTEEHLRHYDVQIAGGLSLADKPKKRKGSVVEMKTGEGKTLTATIPLYISSLQEKGSWLITVNDYLARRDAEWMGPVFTELGRTVAVLAPMNDKGIQPSYIFDPDEERADVVKSMHKVLGIEVVGEDGKIDWALDEESWNAKTRAFTDKGLERLVEENIITQELVPSVEHISAAETILTMNYVLQAMKKNKAPRQVSEPYLKNVLDYKKENPGRFIKVSNAFKRTEGDPGAVDGIHYTFEQEQGRAKLTAEGLKLLSEHGLVEGHSLGDKIASISDIAWGISEGILFDDMPHLRMVSRKEAYDADITYGPSHEFVFDWLGDKHQATDCCQQVQRENLPGYVLLDEVDYILIDDARTPHIINHEIEGMPSQYRFYMGLPEKVKDFEMYEWSAARLEMALQRSTDVHNLLINEMLPLRNFAEGKDGAVKSQRKGGKVKLESKKKTIRSTDINGENEAIITAFDQFEEGIHYEMGDPLLITPEYRLTEEAYKLLHELGATPFPFNIHEFEDNPDPNGLDSTYTMMQPMALLKHHLEQNVDFIYEPIDKKLKLTDRGREKLQQREVIPSEEVINQCGQVYAMLVEELLPFKHSKSRIGKLKLKSVLNEIEGTPLADAFEEFTEDLHYRLRPMPDEGTKEFIITEEGFQSLYRLGAIPHPSPDADTVTIEHGVCNVLKAMKIFKQGEKYVIQPRIDPKTGKLKQQVILVDENSGRYMEGRRISDGLHEAIEAVCGIPIEEANAEIAKISQQMFYDMLPWVAGMSGTAETSEKEFKDVYDLDVKVLPTNIQWRWLIGDEAQGARLKRNVEKIKLDGWLFPMKKITYTDPDTGETFHERVDWPHILVGPISEEELETNEDLNDDFMNYRNLVESVRKRGHDVELPCALQFNLAQFTHYKMLVMDTLEKIEQGRPILLHTVDPNVSKELGEVLKYEAEQSGLDVTVNVLYHENHDKEAKIIEEAGKPFVVTIATNMAGRGVDIKLTEEAREAGGLYTPMGQSNYSARNDNQVKGRAARQGDPGSSQPIISVFDPYIGPFAGEKLVNVVERSGERTPWGAPVYQEPMISKLLRSIQGQIEGRHADSRDHTLDYDKVLDEQRKSFLKERQKMLDLDADGTKEHILSWYDEFIDDVMHKACSVIDYRKMSKQFKSIGPHKLADEELAAHLADETERESLRQEYTGKLDEALERGSITQEERDQFVQGIDTTLKEGRLPKGYDAVFDYQKVSKLFGRIGAYSLTTEGLAASLGDEKERERLSQDYATQLDKALERGYIRQEERGGLGERVEAALEKGFLPRDTIIRPTKKVRLNINPQEIVGEINAFEKKMKEIEESGEEGNKEEERKLAMDGFFDKLENHTYSKALFDLVNQNKISWDDYSREFKGISSFLQTQRGKMETLDEGGKMTFPTLIMKDAPVNVPYDHSGFFEGVIMGTNGDELEKMLKGYVKEAYDARGTADEHFKGSKGAMLQALDHSWMNHLMELESVRTGLKFPNRDPLVQYKREGIVLYREMMGTEDNLGSIVRDIVTTYFRQTKPKPKPKPKMEKKIHPKDSS